MREQVPELAAAPNERNHPLLIEEQSSFQTTDPHLSEK